MAIIDFNEIAVFIRVIEAGSFAAAGRQLQMPSTTVSRKVQQLEASLGVRLLQRTTRKLTLTDAGRSYFQQCQQNIAQIEQANRQITEAQESPSGLIRISAPVDFAVRYLQGWISEFLSRYPQVEINLQLTDRYVDLIEQQIDIAFRTGILQDSSLIARRIGPKRTLVCASPDYLADAGQPQTPHELSRHSCISFGTNNRWQFLDGKEVRSVPVTGRYAVDNMQLVLQAALAGLGIAQLPTSLAIDHLRQGQLQRLLGDFPQPEGGVYVVYPSQKHLAKNVRLFVDHVIEKTSPKAPWDVDLPR